MQKHILSALSFLALTNSAFAADLPSHKEPALVVPPMATWSGIYLGINAGYGGNRIDTSTNGLAAFGGTATSAVGTGSIGVGGPLAGGQVGYNYQFTNNLLLGIETDLDYADINDFNGGQNTNANNFGTGGFSSSNYNRLGLNWLGTTRARLGYSIGNFLPYLTAGVAYGEITNKISNISVGNFGASVAGATQLGSNSVVKGGWAAGAGMEYMVAPAWSAKVEYLYTSLAGITTNVYGSGPGAAGSVSQFTTGSFNIHSVRAGINYHTNWLGSTPVIAKF